MLYLSEKGKIMASAVINVFAMIGMFLFFALSIFFLCGLFEEKQLATGAVITAYASGEFHLSTLWAHKVGNKMHVFNIQEVSAKLYHIATSKA